MSRQLDELKAAVEAETSDDMQPCARVQAATNAPCGEWPGHWSHYPCGDGGKAKGFHDKDKCHKYAAPPKSATPQPCRFEKFMAGSPLASTFADWCETHASFRFSEGDSVCNVASFAPDPTASAVDVAIGTEQPCSHLRDFIASYAASPVILGARESQPIYASCAVCGNGEGPLHLIESGEQCSGPEPHVPGCYGEGK